MASSVPNADGLPRSATASTTSTTADPCMHTAPCVVGQSSSTKWNSIRADAKPQHNRCPKRDLPPWWFVDDEPPAPPLVGGLTAGDGEHYSVTVMKSAPAQALPRLRLDAQFIASLREHGVLQPVSAVRGNDGVIKVRDNAERWARSRLACTASRSTCATPRTPTPRPPPPNGSCTKSWPMITAPR